MKTYEIWAKDYKNQPSKPHRVWIKAESKEQALQILWDKYEMKQVTGTDILTSIRESMEV